VLWICEFPNSLKMKLLAALLREHSKAQRNRIVAFVGTDPDRFGELVKLFLAGPYRVTQRAAWPISYCIEKHPTLIKPYLREMIAKLVEPGLHNAVKRNILRLLQFVELPERLQGIAVANAYRLLEDRTEPIAVHVFAMGIIAHVAKKKPDLRHELKILIEDRFPYGSPAFKSRAKKVLKLLA
jgi:hypothetical protein